MEEILHQLIGSLSHYLQGLMHLNWCRILAINSIIDLKGWMELQKFGSQVALIDDPAPETSHFSPPKNDGKFSTSGSPNLDSKAGSPKNSGAIPVRFGVRGIDHIKPSSSWWFQSTHLKNMRNVKLDHFPKDWDEHEKIFELPSL